MTVEPKEIRIPFMCSDRLLKEIDDWRYEHRIPTRARAIRLLIEKGLKDE